MPLGIENLKKALKFAADFSAQIAATKKINFLSMFAFIDELLELGDVVTSWKDIVAEFKDLQDSERLVLYDYAKLVLNIPNEEVKTFVADSFDWSLKTFALVERARGLKKTPPPSL